MQRGSPASGVGEAALGKGYPSLGSAVLQRLRPYVLAPFLVLLAFLLVFPIFMVVYASFRGGPPGADAAFSLQGYREAWTSGATYKALMTTFVLAVPRVAIGVFFSLLLTWIIIRTNTPGRFIFEQLIWFKVFLPPLPMLVSWLLLLGGSAGAVNKFLMNAFNLSGPPLDLRSFWGVIFLSFMTGGSMFFLYVSPAFRNMDASLEESSRVSGANNLTTLFRVTAPLLMPAILGITFLMFLFTLSSYETELFLLAPKGKYVFTTWIWWEAQKMPPNYPSAMAMSSAFLFFVAAVILLQFKILGTRQYTTVTGRGFNIRPTDLGKWRWVTFGFLSSWFLIGLVVPLILLVWGSFLNTYGVLGSGLTLEYWKDALSRPSVIRSVKNTMILGVMVASMSVVLYGLMSYLSLRTKLKGRQMIEILSWIPRAAPAVVLSLGIVWAVLGGIIPGVKFIYGTLFLMAMVILLERTPQGMRLVNGGMIQLSMELEEASRVSGASWLRTIRRVVFPLLIPTFLNEWLLSFMAATRALVLLLFIYIPSSKVLAIDIFERMVTSQPQQAAILGVMLTAISMMVAIAARIVAFQQRRSLGAGAGM